MNNSELLFERAQLFIPGGVNSPVRAFRSVGGTPLFFKSAKGSILTDVDDKEYIDFIGTWGPMILGHCHEPIVKTLKEATNNTTSFGAPTELEADIAELICEMVPAVEKVRMTNSGTEACMSAIRVARGYTNREKFIKFEGNYHGHADAFLIKAGSGAITLGVPNSPGVTKGTAQDTLLAPYNDLDAVKRIIDENPDQIAAIILEPVAGNMGCIPPKKGFLEGLRNLCDKHHIVLIFDEVMTGFRLAKGGASEHYGIVPDMVTLGKIIGGGLPVGAFGGKDEIMELFDPTSSNYDIAHAGTFNGNPLTMEAGVTVMENLTSNNFEKMNHLGDSLRSKLSSVFNEINLDVQVTGYGSLFGINFNENKIKDYRSFLNNNSDMTKILFSYLRNKGILLQLKNAGALNILMTEKEIDYLVDSTREISSEMKDTLDE